MPLLHEVNSTTLMWLDLLHKNALFSDGQYIPINWHHLICVSKLWLALFKLSNIFILLYFALISISPLLDCKQGFSRRYDKSKPKSFSFFLCLSKYIWSSKGDMVIHNNKYNILLFYDYAYCDREWFRISRRYFKLQISIQE